MTEADYCRRMVEQQRAREASFLKIGAGCAVLGTVGYVIAFVLHGDLPDQTTESVLEFIAARPWALHHLGIVFCFLLWLAALTALANSLDAGVSWALGRLGVVATIIGVTILMWHYNIDGPALEQVADAWAAAAGPERSLQLERGTILLLTTAGMFPLYVTVLLGLPFILFGVAITLGNEYPSWLGWMATIAGLLAFAVGATNFAGLDLLPMNLFVLTVLVIDIWMIAMGLLMWRRAALVGSGQDDGSQ